MPRFMCNCPGDLISSQAGIHEAHASAADNLTADVGYFDVFDPNVASLPPFGASTVAPLTQAPLLHDNVHAIGYVPDVLHDSSGRSVHARVSTQGVDCKWGATCGHHLANPNAGSIGRHIREYHFHEHISPWQDRARGPCQWWDNGGICGKMVLYGGLGKHVATVHIQSTIRECPRCHRKLSRIDSLRRHERYHCRTRRVA
ncbi:hypothetical protein WOLCODRAFT_23582 [Wolfiporia cocos MD-104 SS10]|uniref:C2H2-type domain-containing protein n=1 Tax=Wolfiporia cocos (strain MD-104) TaxID=742152 RepID=A0A2H3JLQ6_WOLCO|nr:hypothetical protein WOLCODRAFT_23582 [Wolfiporia cocos MD-104 SS10]